MEQVFASLTKRQQMLLLTSLALGGQDAVESFGHLPPDEEELLKYRAPMLLQIPRDKRISFLTQEIKRLVMQRRKQLGSAEPEQLAAVMSGERPGLIEVVLRSLPSDLADATRRALPGHRADSDADIRPDIQSIIRARLEEQIRAKAPPVGVFRFSDVITLQQRELLAVIDRMGARVLATAVAGLIEIDRDQFLSKLPPDQRNLATRAAEAGKAKRLNVDDARLCLEMHGAIENPSTGMRSAGAQRVMRAAIAQSPEFATRLVDRHQGSDLGKLLARWLRDEQHRPVKADGGRMDIVEQLERLAQKGVLDRPIRLPPPLKPSPRLGASENMLSGVLPALRSQASRQALPKVPGLPGGQVVAPPVREPQRQGGGAQRPKPAGAGTVQGTETGERRRILRDGRPMDRQAVASPATQPIPRRKNQSVRTGTGSNARSPVLRGRRGPGDGSE